ncbi:YesL family protein [Gracilibacillus sp. D59]|uniref:YesL family protein n=1 Tax=Gracilibacillus sp. D59 TaxID=3457434 RepID=UPI003FCD0BD9
MELRGIWGVFYKISIWLTRVASVNLLWFLFNLPVAIFLFNILLANYIGELIVSLTLIVILIPLVTFPATTALFAVVRKWVLGKDIKLVKDFWNYYKQNYLNSLKGGIFITLVWSSMLFYFYILKFNSLEIFTYLFYLLLAILFVFTIHFFSITVHFHSKTIIVLKNALSFTIINPILTIEILVVSGLLIYLSSTYFSFLIPFFIGSTIAFVSFLGFHRFTSRLKIVD